MIGAVNVKDFVAPGRAAYMADDSLMVATAVIALSSRKLTERAGAWLKLLSGAVMLALGIVMLVRPDWLA